MRAALAMRIGLHSGLVVAARSLDNGSPGVSGDTVNQAFCLQEAAAPNTVLVSGETHRWISHAFETAEVGPLALRPGMEPKTAFRVLRARPDAGKLRGVAGLDSPLVGRQVELAALRGALERLRGGQGGIVTTVGEAGIGKSRLVAELRKFLDGRNSEPAEPGWIEGRCLSYGSSAAYHLWRDLLHAAVGVSLEEPPAAVAQSLEQWVARVSPDNQEAITPYLERLMALPLGEAWAQQLGQLDAATLQQRTFVAAEAVTRGAASRRPGIS